ncbi:MAG: hypothetical protein EP330_13965 [Deltaproteobacteria bacterium]|nr:MAG: hypothetical protein EP330_13965 [Deltaproteobacteria bacterium]
MRELVVAAMLVGCAGTSTEDSGEELTFSQSSTLADPLYADTCQGLYWPVAMSHFPVALIPVEAPAAPYQITGFSGEMFNLTAGFANGRDCDASHGVTVFAYLSDVAPSEVPASGMPVPTKVAEATLATDEVGDIVHASVTLDTPVAVEDGQSLWVGYDASLDAGSGAGACFSGCETGSGGMYMWQEAGSTMGGTGDWTNRPELVLLAVEVAHN